MTIAWMLYTVLVTTLLFLGAIAAEFVCRALRAPTRFVWAAAFCLSVGFSARALLTADQTSDAVSPSSTTVFDAAGVADGDEPAPAASPSLPARSAAVSSQLVAILQTILEAPSRAVTSLTSAAGRIDLPIAVILIAAAVAGVGYLVAVAIRVRRVVGALEPHVLDGRQVFVSDQFGPALLGILNPRIVIPRWVLSMTRRQRSVIVAHEQQHDDARDPAVLALAAVGVALMPWNAGLWFAFARLRLAIEVDCDRRVMAAQGDVHGYGDLLVTVYERAAASRLQLAFVQGPSNLEHRIRRLVGRAPKLASRRGGFALATAIALAIAACETSAPTRTSTASRENSATTVQPVASVVGVLPRCISGGRKKQAPMEMFDELRSLARQRHPEAFDPTRTAEWLIALVLDENCAVQRDTVIVTSNSDLAFQYFAKVLGDSIGARNKGGHAWDGRTKLAIAYVINPSPSWRARTESTPCGIGIRFDESCGAQGPLEIRKLDSVHALVAVRGFNAPNKRADELFLITLARPTSALATQSMAHGVVAYQSGALYLEDYLARAPQVWIGTQASTGLETTKRRRGVQVIDQLVGIAHYSGHPLTLEQVAQLRPTAKCDGAPGSCYETAGVAIMFP